MGLLIRISLLSLVCLVLMASVSVDARRSRNRGRHSNRGCRRVVAFLARRRIAAEYVSFKSDDCVTFSARSRAPRTVGAEHDSYVDDEVMSYGDAAGDDDGAGARDNLNTEDFLNELHYKLNNGDEDSDDSEDDGDEDSDDSEDDGDDDDSVDDNNNDENLDEADSVSELAERRTASEANNRHFSTRPVLDRILNRFRGTCQRGYRQVTIAASSRLTSCQSRGCKRLAACLPFSYHKFCFKCKGNNTSGTPAATEAAKPAVTPAVHRKTTPPPPAVPTTQALTTAAAINTEETTAVPITEETTAVPTSKETAAAPTSKEATVVPTSGDTGITTPQEAVMVPVAEIGDANPEQTVRSAADKSSAHAALASDEDEDDREDEDDEDSDDDGNGFGSEDDDDENDEYEEDSDESEDDDEEEEEENSYSDDDSEDDSNHHDFFHMFTGVRNQQERRLESQRRHDSVNQLNRLLSAHRQAATGAHHAEQKTNADVEYHAEE